MAARVMVPEMKCELDLYKYVLVQTYFNIVHTFYPKYVPSTYYFPRVCTRYILVCTVFTKLLQSMLFYIVCRVGNNTMCA